MKVYFFEGGILRSDKGFFVTGTNGVVAQTICPCLAH